MEGRPAKIGLCVGGNRKISKDETWTQPWGEQRKVRNNYNEPSVTLQETRENSRKLRVIFRVFNDTIAFRYEWPEQAVPKDFNIMDELTEFVFPADHTALWEPV